MFDGDGIIHLIASAAEKRTIKVTHDDFKEPLILNTRTELWGRKRGKSSGYLASLNEERLQKSLPKILPEDLTIEDIQEPEPLPYCLNSAKKYILGVCEKLDCFDYNIYIGDGITFREKILMPEGRRYKQNRENLVRAVRVEELKDYLVEKHDAKLITDIEVDDHVAMIGYANYKRLIKKGCSKYDDMDIIISRDKDAYACEGWLFNPDKGKMKEPIFIHGLGVLKLDGSKVVGIGRKFKYFQLLFGDSVDNYKPTKIPGVNIKYGEKTILKDFENLHTDYDFWSFIVSKYRQWMPEPVMYKAWDGSEVTDTWLSWLQKHLTMQHMRRFPGDEPKVVDILKKVGVSYEG